ncbi:MAG TPA: hypothetical protein VGO41_01205 [Steroidobacteraceae bacterium]|jgi:hypothetical protein|nr:hypothetical protein [Steroidobacteraceae bacterium]
MNIEQQLRDALRPEEPDAGFAARLQARLDAQSAQAAMPGAWRPHSARRRWLLPGALAATLLLAFGIAQQVGQRNERREQQRELYAHEQLMQALAITSSRLDNVHRHLKRDFLEE